MGNERKEVGAVSNSGHLGKNLERLVEGKHKTELDLKKYVSVITPYLHEKDDNVTHYMSAADETGTLYLLEMPKHLREPTEYMVRRT